MKKILFVSIFACSIALSFFSINEATTELAFSDLFNTRTAFAESGTGKVKDVTTEQKLVITKVTGDAALEFSLGDIFDAGTELEAGVTAELKDCYTVACYDDGSCVCTEVSEPKVCASSGCPENCGN